MNTKHKKYWDSIPGLKDANVFYKEHLPKELLKLNRNQ
jgi:hypothetical protein